MDPHPHGVQPLGNLAFRREGDTGPPNLARRVGLGGLRVLTDELLLGVLGYLEALDLARLAVASRALFAFALHDDLWRALVLTGLEGDWRFHHNWRGTYVHTHNLGEAARPPPKRAKRKTDEAGERRAAPSGGQLRLASRLFSDVLFQPWYCANVPLRPEWLEVENVDRRSNLSSEDFRCCYEKANRPVVLTDVAHKWAACTKWTNEHLLKAYGANPCVVGGYDMKLPDYLQYAQQASCDDQPLYLFDKHFADRAPTLLEDFAVPTYFNEDLFSCLGTHRPDYRWLIIGPKRSGSSFHQDPNNTSAWNAVVSGKKRWILFPPSTVPPGVHPSHDGANVAAPVSLIEWYLNFYAEAREGDVQPYECTCDKGEIIFVPRGWWHMVLNLEDSVALTQNFVSSVNLPHVLKLLSTRNPELVSGCSYDDRCTLYDRFTAALQTHHPALLASYQRLQAEQSEARKKQQSLAMLFKDDAGGTGAGAGAANPSSNAAAGSQPFGLRTDSDSAAGTGTGQSGAAAAEGSSGHFTFNFEIAPKGTPELVNNCSAAAGGFKFNFFG